MTEEQQARAIAEWLDNPIGPPPQGIDADVLEAVALLRPELVPKHGVSAESVVVAAEEPTIVPLVHRSSQSPWRRRLGGVGVLLAAAISGVVFLPNAPWLQDQPEMAPTVFMEETLEADVDVVQAAAPEAEDPIGGADHVMVRSASAPSETTKHYVQRAQGGPPDLPSQKKPTQSKEMAPATYDNATATAAPLALAPEPPPQMPPPRQASEALSINAIVPPSEAQRIGSATGASIGGENALNEQATPTTRSAGTRGGQRARAFKPAATRRSLDAKVSAESAAEDDASTETVDPLLLLRQEVVARLGPFPSLSESASQEQQLLHEARTRLDEAQPSIALQLCQDALSLGRGGTPERRWLALVRGDAYRMLSRDRDAESSYREALSGKVR